MSDICSMCLAECDNLNDTTVGELCDDCWADFKIEIKERLEAMIDDLEKEKREQRKINEG